MGAEQAVADQYEVLMIDDVCSFLTPRLVRSLREHGREIVGVYSPVDAPDAKRHLLECGITDVVESDAGAEEFLAAAVSTMLHRRPAQGASVSGSRSFTMGVVGPLGGVGVTEVAIALASGLASSRTAVLIDLDQQNPSIAQRLDLPLHPNLMTAVDSAHHSGELGGALIDHEHMSIVGGLANPGGPALAPAEIDGLLHELGGIGFDLIVADLGGIRPGWPDLPRFDAMIAVGLASPVGLARLVRTVQTVASGENETDTVAVVNRVGAGGRRRLEIKAEMARLMPLTPIVLLPEDRGLERAAWDGSLLSRGPFARAVGRIAALIDQVA
jgi:MinD-like ATPase involved in chromosome partitioning or flagellar assembly